MSSTKSRDAAPPSTTAPPSRLDLWPASMGPPAWVQNAAMGASEACTAFATGAAAYFVARRRMRRDPGTPDFAFIYNNEYYLTRMAIRYFHDLEVHKKPKVQDFGAFNIRAAARVAAMFGVPFLRKGRSCLKQRFSYEPPPPFDAFVRARRHMTVFQPLFHVPDVDPNAPCIPPQPQEGPRHLTVRQSLLEGTPVITGFYFFRNMTQSSQGDIGGAISRLGPITGAHAVLIVGYDDELRRFRFRNSAGTAWGDEGYGTLPYAWIDSEKATFGMTALQPRDGTFQVPVMFRKLEVTNRRTTTANVQIQAFDGQRRFLGHRTMRVGPGERRIIHPVRWINTYRLIVAGAPPLPSPESKALELIMNCANGSSARTCRVTIPAEPAKIPQGQFYGVGGGRLRCIERRVVPLLLLDPA